MMTAFLNIPDLGCGKVQSNGGLRPAHRVAQKAGDIADAGLRLIDDSRMDEEGVHDAGIDL